jgi:hypothetical protein
MLTGHRKSGTTLLHKLFDGHPYLNVYPVDLCLLYAFYPYWTTPEFGPLERKERLSLVIKKSTSPFYGKKISESIKKFDCEEFLNLFWEKNNPEVLTRPSCIVQAVGESYCEYAGLDKSLPFLFKETSQTVNLQGMLDDGMDVTAAQIIRDPRDNYAAIKAGVSHYYEKMGEGEKESLASVLNRARMDLDLGWQEQNTNRKAFFAVRFEDLVTEPHKAMDGLVRFMDISWEDSLLRPTLLGEFFSGNSHEGKKFSGISEESVGRWKDRITKFEASVIEGWMATSMASWGYPLEYGHDEHVRALSDFYSWYNSKYFYRDSFGSKSE